MKGDCEGDEWGGGGGGRGGGKEGLRGRGRVERGWIDG